MSLIILECARKIADNKTNSSYGDHVTSLEINCLRLRIFPYTAELLHIPGQYMSI